MRKSITTGDDLTDALVYLEEFAPDIERSEFERRVCNLFENKWMIDLIDKAMSKVYDYYNNGRLYSTRYSPRVI